MGGGVKSEGVGRWLITITICKAAVNKDVDLIVKHGRVGINEVFRGSDFKILVYYRGPCTMVYLPLVGCETISDGTRETSF